MLRNILTAYFACASAVLAAPTATCDRDFLKSQTAAYIAAQAAGKADGLKASSSVAYTQNFKTTSLATGILATPLRIDGNRSTYDTTQCATFTELITTQTGNTHVIGTQMRFTDGALSKMETIVTSTGDWLFNPANTLKYAQQESWTEIPEAKRDTRAVIQAAADAYLDLFNDKSVKVPWGNPCARLEGGSYIQPSCNVGVPSGIKNTNRRYVVDEVLGSCDVFFTFGGAEPDTHEFRVENGKLRYVHTMTVMKLGTSQRREPTGFSPSTTLSFTLQFLKFIVPHRTILNTGNTTNFHPIGSLQSHGPGSNHSRFADPRPLTTGCKNQAIIMQVTDGHVDEGQDGPAAAATTAATEDVTAAVDCPPSRPASAPAPLPPPPAYAGPDMHLVFDCSPLPLLLLSPSCTITRASHRFLADWHVSADECLGQQVDIFLKKHLDPTSIDPARYILNAIDNAVASRSERTSKSVPAKTNRSCTARVIPIFNHDQLIAISLEWHERPPELLQGGELVQPGLSTDEAFRILVQALKDYAIFLLDTSGHIATWNTGAQLLKGYTRDEIIGKHFSIFYGKEDLDIKKPEKELDICLREGRVEDEGWRYKKDGSRFWANVIITAIYKDGVHVGFGKVTRDLTERKASESRLIAAYEESEKLKSDFLANMSHEIRTPMHGMLSACSLLMDTQLTERQRDIIGIMDESGQVLLQVINDILDYSKLASGSFSVTSDVIGVTSIITSVVRSVQTTLKPAVHFELFLAPNLPKSVQGDPLRYRQIVQNIIGNAAKFTDKGSIRVRVSVQAVDLESFTVLTEVTDTGIGIPEDAAAILFTPFTQFDVTTTKRYKGTGLGLSIAKSLVELMGGRIGYRPNPERHGSIFWFTARFKKIKSLGQIQDWKQDGSGADRSPMPLPSTDMADIQAELAHAATRKTLLLVEDNVINQKVMLGMLRSIGFKNIDLASDGVEAVSMVRGKPVGYDLVLMDINMPVLDGHEASRQIRNAGIHVPIVAMTAYALKGDRERCLEYGMNDYVPKPVDKKYLIKTLARWLISTRDYRKPPWENGADSPMKATEAVKVPPTVVEVMSHHQYDDDYLSR
ncbi:hypothetical protein B0H66DRAFT_470359 [Apodospora peruviana]|uniref:Two-component system protein A n=1 Tax=Apodospora peruviana TaxID=516989 RepID=A0AAE0MC20_9PEZI|nr:hypothetical protein B0H66DRAFT_470359 [Apodospora peruviana]